MAVQEAPDIGKYAPPPELEYRSTEQDRSEWFGSGHRIELSEDAGMHIPRVPFDRFGLYRNMPAPEVTPLLRSLPKPEDAPVRPPVGGLLAFLAIPTAMGVLGARRYGAAGGLAGFGGGLALELGAVSCGPSGQEAPPAITAEIPATAMPAETGTPSLGNEVIPGTPSLVPETPVPVGSAYPTEVSGMTDPKVYSYGGPEGRANLNEYARTMFDRYIAEMARTGILSGASVEELYRSFDAVYDMKLFTTDAGQVYLVQSKSDGSFLVPKTQDGQLFRDLQLSHDYLFQNGVAVPVGNDNFDLQKFPANRVGFVGAWPVLVSVDAQNVPVSWVNMERGGAASPIQLASATATPEVAVVTPTPEGQVQLSVGGETFTVTRDVKYRDGQATVDIDPSRAQKIGDLLVHSDAAGRLIWNEHLASWTPEFGTNMDYSRPELSPFVPIDAFYDGSKPGDAIFVPSSVALSDRLYLAEHPEIIAADAAIPYYRISLAVNESGPVGYIIALTGPNQYLLTNENTTQISKTTRMPFAYFGMQQTTNKAGEVIFIIKRASLNPTESDPRGIVTMNMGLNTQGYLEGKDNPLTQKYLAANDTSPGELVPVFPNNYNSYQFSPETFSYNRTVSNPAVASLLSVSMIEMFDADTQQQIRDLVKGYGVQFDPVTNPGSFQVDALPQELSNMILYTAFQSWFR